jgi:hypothetical protein
MSKMAILAGLAAAASLCVAADRFPVSAAFGNTIVSTYPDGRTAEIWLYPNGSYASENRKHDASSGHWNLKNDKICFHQSHPFLPFATFCTVMPPAKVGSTWKSKSPTGEPTVLRLVRGHVRGSQVTAAQRTDASTGERDSSGG